MKCPATHSPPSDEVGFRRRSLSKHADESPSRRRGPRALVSISVSPTGATRAPRRGTRPRVALTLSSLAPGRLSERALSWAGQTARATRGRDLQLNVPLPRKPPDLLMAESPPAGGLSALTGAMRSRASVVPEGAVSGQDVVQRRREALARLL